MPMLCYRPIVRDFYGRPQFPCSVNPIEFVDKLSFWIYNRFGGVNLQDVTWSTYDPLSMYHQVVVLRRVIHVECEFQTPRFWRMRAKLQVSIEFDVTVRLISEQVVDWIDVREDPLKRGHVQCRWPKPYDPATTVINTDGSWSFIEDRAGIGCMVRTCQGEPLGAYSAICDKMPVHVIETWSVHEGLRLTATSDLGVVLIETDATIAVSLINRVAAAYSNLLNKCTINYHNYLKESSRVAIRANSPKEDKDLEGYVKTVIKNHAKWTKNGQLQGTSLEFLVKTLIEIMYFLEPLDGWGCRHIMREANRAADHLTHLAKVEEIILVKTENYPAELLKIVEEDVAETWYERRKQTPISGHKCTKASGWMLPQ